MKANRSKRFASGVLQAPADAAITDLALGTCCPHDAVLQSESHHDVQRNANIVSRVIGRALVYLAGLARTVPCILKSSVGTLSQ